jgi:hypothetical protein
MCTVFVTVMQYMLQLNFRDIFQTEYQLKDRLLGDHRTSSDTGSLTPGVRVPAEYEANQGINEQENNIKMVQRSPCPRMNARCYMPFLHAEGT